MHIGIYAYAGSETRVAYVRIYTMQRYLTFTTDLDETVRVSPDTASSLPCDWVDYIWQWAESHEQAIAQHAAKVDEREEWLNAANAEKPTY